MKEMSSAKRDGVIAGMVALVVTVLFVLGSLVGAGRFRALVNSLPETVRVQLAEQGWRAERGGDVDAAEQYYRRTLEIEHEGDVLKSLTQKRLGTLLWHEGRTEEAYPLLTRAVSMDNPPLHYYIPLVDIALSRGERSEDRSELKEYLQRWRVAVDKKDSGTYLAMVYYSLGRVYLQEDQETAAQEAFEQALALEPSSRAAYELGLLAEARGDAEGARKYFEQFLLQGNQGAEAAHAREAMRKVLEN